FLGKEVFLDVILEVDDPRGRRGADRGAEDGLDKVALNALVRAKPWIRVRRHGDDRAASGDGLGDDAARERGADDGDVIVLTAVSDPEGRLVLIVRIGTELDVPHASARELDDQRERVGEKRLDFLGLPELEELTIEVSLLLCSGPVSPLRSGRGA